MEEKKPEPPKPKVIKSFLCEKCSFEAKSDQEYKQHRVDHNLGKEFKTIHPVTGEPTENKPVEAPVVPKEGSEIVKKALPKEFVDYISDIDASLRNKAIKLKYIYEGTCPACGAQVKTIPINDLPEKGKTTVVAWCPKEDTNIQQRIVARL